MVGTRPLVLLILALAACAGTPPPEASGPPDWSALAAERVPELVTHDPDGEERVTKLWLVVVDGHGYLRTGNTRWFRNLERDPAVMLRAAGAAYPLRAVLELDAAVRERVVEAFGAKYGFQERMLRMFGGGSTDSNIVRLEPR